MRPFLRLATCLALAACGSAPTAPGTPHRPVAGKWLGETGGFRIRLNATEAFIGPGAFSFYQLGGSGTLTTIATGDSLPLTLSGVSPVEGTATVFLHMNIYGHPELSGGTAAGQITGRIEANGDFVGTLYTDSQGMVGPLANPLYGPAPITLRPQ